jgi:dCMP deaminase
MRPDWNEYFMAIAKIVSTRSTCNSRPVGAVIVRDKQILATGYNGAVSHAPHCIEGPGGNEDPFCFRRSINAPEEDKYNYCRANHAEANAIAQAARLGVPLEGSTLYITMTPCYVCLKMLSTARVLDIYYEYDYESTKKDRDKFWKTMVRECGIKTFEELRISDRTITSVVHAMKYPTSVRRLSEPPSKNENMMTLTSEIDSTGTNSTRTDSTGIDSTGTDSTGIDSTK